jgi:hypothetical protein
MINMGGTVLSEDASHMRSTEKRGDKTTRYNCKFTWNFYFLPPSL